MTRLFSTQFPLASESELESILNIGKSWITSSPHALLNKSEVLSLKNHGDSSKNRGFSAEIGIVSSSDYSSVGIKYITPSRENDNWQTIVIGTKSPIECRVSVTVDYETEQERISLPIAKKPLIIEALLDNLGGGRDGSLTVAETPTYLPDDKVIAPLISDILQGETNSVMPIVYVSRDSQNLTQINNERLSRLLSGIAHVMIEPSRGFSFEMREHMQGSNVYDGAVGVYWTEGTGRLFWVSSTLKEERDPEQMIYSRIVEALCSRRLKKELTWDNLQGVYNQQQTKKLIAEFEEKKKAMEGNFRQEQESIFEGLLKEDERKTNLLKEYEEANARLESRLRGTRAHSSGTGVVEDPQVTEIYEGEVRKVVIDAINSAANNIPKNTRRKMILKEVIKCSPCTDKREEIEETIKRLFNDYTHLSGPMRKDLLRLGFSIQEEGKHYKLTFANDPRSPSVTFPKTPGDCRSGKNTASEIVRNFF